MFSHVKSLRTDIVSIRMMSGLLHGLKYLEHVLFSYKFETRTPYITIKWLRRNVCRLRRKNFTDQEAEFNLLLSLGDKRKTNNKYSDFSSNVISVLE